MSHEIILDLCPFCGSRAEMISAEPCHWIRCTGCKIETISFHNVEDLVESWNKRIGEGEWQRIASSLKAECIRLSKER